jgi:hypothetical protein
MVCAQGPLSLVMLAVSPVYMLFDRESKYLKPFNSMLQIVFYLPIAVVVSALFLLLNIMCWPLAYAVALV